MKDFIHEFKEFAIKGNVVDLAVGVIIGGAFSKIISSLVADIITPFISLIIGSVNLTSITLNLGRATIAYGDFIQNIIDFFIQALVIFLIVKFINAIRRHHAGPAPLAAPRIPSEEEKLLVEIRDLLAKGNSKK